MNKLDSVRVDWGAWETNWVSEEVSETYVETTVEALGKIHPDDLPEGVQTKSTTYCKLSKSS